MDHILQFAIGIDDDAIIKRVEEHAERQIIQNIEKAVKKQLFTADWRGNVSDYSPLSEYSKEIFIGFLEQNRDQILKKAAECLADKLLKTKRGKELLEKVDKEEV